VREFSHFLPCAQNIMFPLCKFGDEWKKTESYIMWSIGSKVTKPQTRVIYDSYRNRRHRVEFNIRVGIFLLAITPSGMVTRRALFAFGVPYGRQIHGMMKKMWLQSSLGEWSRAPLLSPARAPLRHVARCVYCRIRGLKRIFRWKIFSRRTPVSRVRISIARGFTEGFLSQSLISNSFHTCEATRRNC